MIKKGNVVRIAPQDIAKEIMDGFNQRSNDIMNLGFVEETFAELAKEEATSLFLSISGQSGNNMFRVLNKVLRNHFWDWYVNRLYNGKKLCSARNRVECESLRELLIYSLAEKQKR